MGEVESNDQPAATPDTGDAEQATSAQRPAAEDAARAETTGLDAGQATQPATNQENAQPAIPEASDARDDAAFNPRNLRVSDAEREHVVGVLQKAIGRGMLDLDEFTERTDTAFAARTRGELNVVLADLAGLVHADAVQGAPHAVAPGNPEGTDNPNRLELRAQGSSLTRRGRWFVPTELAVYNKYGSTKLDFTEAHVAGPIVHIELDTKWGSVELIVPEQATVDVNAVTEVKWGSLDDKTRSNRIDGTPKYVVSGRVHGGSLTVRNPRRGLFM